MDILMVYETNARFSFFYQSLHKSWSIWFGENGRKNDIRLLSFLFRHRHLVIIKNTRKLKIWTKMKNENVTKLFNGIIVLIPLRQTGLFS